VSGNGKREFANVVSIARGSLRELDTHCLIAVDLGYLPQDRAAFASLDRVSKLLTGLYRHLTADAALNRKKSQGDFP
jgi:four helix bundle protein